MSLVLDTSVSLGWCFEDERTPALDALLDRVAEGGAVVPSLWTLEVANGLQMAIRRGRIDYAFRDMALNHLTNLNLTMDGETARHAWNDTLMLADRFGLTLYDACYLEIARRRTLPLATLDQDLRQAATRLGIPLLGTAADAS